MVSVTANFAPPDAEEITKSAGIVKMRLISQWIKGISRVFQKLLKYFNGTAILTTFALPFLGLFSVTFTWDMHESKSIKVSLGSSL